jgi:ferredoxin
MNLASMADHVAAIERSIVILNSPRCLHAMGKFSACQACSEACPVGAIQPGKPPVLNADACETCLACLPVCPTGALTADDAVPALLNCAARVETGALEIVCQRHPQANAGLAADNTAVRVHGCLAGLGVGAFVALAALGMPQVLVRADACGQCAWASLQPRLEQNVDQARRLLEPWGRAAALVTVTAPPAPAAERPLWEANNPPLSRRDLFRMASRRGQVVAARAMTGEAAPAERAPARERQRLWNALQHLPHDQQTNAGSLPAGPGTAVVSVSDACSACGACARICPTGALSYEVQTEPSPTYRLTFLPWACNGCDACTHACLPGAITLDTAPAFEAVFGLPEPAVLRAGALVRCKRCRTWMAAKPGVLLCPTCDFRRQNPFGARPIPAQKPVRS